MRVSRSGSQTRARNRVVMVRMTPEEEARYRAFAERRGTSLPELMRTAMDAVLMLERAPRRDN